MGTVLFFQMCRTFRSFSQEESVLKRHEYVDAFPGRGHSLVSVASLRLSG